MKIADRVLSLSLNFVISEKGLPSSSALKTATVVLDIQSQTSGVCCLGRGMLVAAIGVPQFGVE